MSQLSVECFYASASISGISSTMETAPTAMASMSRLGLSRSLSPGESAFRQLCAKLSSQARPALARSWREGAQEHSDPIVLVVAAEGDNRLHAFRADNGEPLASPPETNARFAPFSDAHRRRRPALCRRLRTRLKVAHLPFVRAGLRMSALHQLSRPRSRSAMSASRQLQSSAGMRK